MSPGGRYHVLVEEYMHRPFLSLVTYVTYVTFAACARSAAPLEAPKPSPEPVASPPSPPIPATPDASVSHEYRGAYTRGFEASWFAPCDAPMDDAFWWVTLTEGARLQRDSLLKAMTRPATGALVVRWRGTISARMPAG
jgi:hypothetical protein